jgi:hypothetical protein
MMSTTASLGLILLWDVDGGLTQIDKYLYSSEDYIKVINRCRNIRTNKFVILFYDIFISFSGWCFIGLRYCKLRGA